MTLTLLVFQKNSQLTAISPGLVNPSHCTGLYNLDNQIFLITTDDENGEATYRWLDLVFTHPEIQSETTWDNVISYLTDLATTTIPIPTHFKVSQTLDELGSVVGEEYAITTTRPCYRPLKVHAVDSTNIAEVYYDSFTGSPYYYSKPFLRSRQDVRFDLSNQPFHPVPANLIPCCHGSLYLPFVDGDDLYAIGARKALEATFIDTPENLLLDFTPFGGMHAISFSECEVTIATDKHVEVVLPEMTGLENSAYMLVLSGKLFLNGEYGIRRLSERLLTIPSQVVWANGYRLSEKAETETTRWGTPQVQVPAYYELSLHDLRTSPTNFVIVLNAPSVYQIKLPMTTKYGEYAVRFPKQASGLLREKGTRAIRDYVVADFDNANLLSVSRYPDLWTVKNTPTRHDMRTVASMMVRDDNLLYVNLTHQGWELVEFVISEE